MVSVPEVSVCRLSGVHVSAAPELAGGAELDDELELPQPEAATARAMKATARSLLIISGTSRKRGRGSAADYHGTGARPVVDRTPAPCLPHPTGHCENVISGAVHVAWNGGDSGDERNTCVPIGGGAWNT